MSTCGRRSTGSIVRTLSSATEWAAVVVLPGKGRIARGTARYSGPSGSRDVEMCGISAFSASACTAGSEADPSGLNLLVVQSMAPRSPSGRRRRVMPRFAWASPQLRRWTTPVEPERRRATLRDAWKAKRLGLAEPAQASGRDPEGDPARIAERVEAISSVRRHHREHDGAWCVLLAAT